MLKKAIERDKGYTEAIAIDVAVLYRLHDYTNGLAMTQLAIDDKKSAQNYFYHARNLDSLKNLPEAEKFYRASKMADAKFMPGFYGLAMTLLKENKAEDALKTCEEGLTKEPSNMDLTYAKSMSFAAKKDFQSAINEITKVIMTRPDANAYTLRASYYETLGQFHTAVSDYGQVLKLDEKNANIYLKRAIANEQIQNFKGALADYNKVAQLSGGNSTISAIVDQARKKDLRTQPRNSQT